MFSNVGLTVATFVLAFMANFSFAITGFGSAIIFQIGWNVFDLLGMLNPGDGFADGIMNLTVIGIVITTVQVWHLRENINCRLGCVLAATRAVGHVTGAWVLVSLDQLEWLKRVLGAVFLLIAFHKCSKLAMCKKREVKYQAAVDQQHEVQVQKFQLGSLKVRAAVSTAGLASGFLAGLMGTGGPPIMVLLSYFTVPKDEYRATAAMMILVGNIFGIIFMGSTSDKYFKPALLPQYVVMISGALMGLAVGNSLSSFVSQAQFGVIVLALLVFGSILMLLAAEGKDRLPRVVPIAAAALLCALFVSLLAMVCSSSCRPHRIDSPEETELFELELDPEKSAAGNLCSSQIENVEHTSAI